MYIKVEHLNLDMPELFVFPASNLFNPQIFG